MDGILSRTNFVSWRQTGEKGRQLVIIVTNFILQQSSTDRQTDLVILVGISTGMHAALWHR